MIDTGRIGVSVVVIGVGSLCALGGLYWVVHMFHFLRRGVTTKARVAGYETSVSESADDGPQTFAHPLLEFSDAAGKKHRVRMSVGTSGMKLPAAGSYVDVVYDPGDPQGALIRRFSYLWALPLIVSGVGLAMMTLGMVVLYR